MCRLFCQFCQNFCSLFFWQRYCKIDGIYRDPDEPTHWYWAYKYEEKSPKAKSANGFITRAVSVPSNKVYSVRYAIAEGRCFRTIANRQSVVQVLGMIKSGKT